MEGTERIVLMGFVSEPATAEELEILEDDVRLAQILLRTGRVTTDGLARGAKLRRETGLLFEHCLVRAGAVDFNEMLDALADRRNRLQGDKPHRKPVSAMRP
jgi:hypothetical protein